jgi:predicted MFS family arabinose efflux permease
MSGPRRTVWHFAARNWPLLLAMSFGAGLAHIATTGMPLQVGALMDGTARSASQAGLFALVEVASLSLGMIVISLCFAQIKPIHMAVDGAILVALANLSLFVAKGFPTQLILGGCAGVGFGLVYSATVAAGASNDDADRVYAVGIGGSLPLVMLVMTSLPFASAPLGALGVFASLSGFALLCLPLFLGFKAATIVKPIRASQARPAVWRAAGAAGLLFIWAMFSTGTAGAYVFAERIGRSIHAAPRAVGLILSMGVFTGLIGASLAAFVNQRFNRRNGLIGGLVGSALACFLIGHAATLQSFATGVVLYWIFTMFLYCSLLATAAVLDPSGHLGTFGSGTERFGYAIGAWTGGLLAQHISYASTGTFGCIACSAAVIVGFPTLFRVLTERESIARITDAEQPVSCDDRA